MSYKFSTGSVRQGDIYYEDDAETYIDFDDDKIALNANTVTYAADANAASWRAHEFVGGGLYINTNNLFFTNDQGINWGDSSVQIFGNGSTEQLTIKADSTAYFFLDGDASPGKIGIGTSTPGSFFQISGSVANNLTSFAANTNIDETHYTLVGDCDSDNATFTLPAATDAMSGRIYIIKRADSGGNGGGNTLTVDRNGKLIDGAAGNLSLGNGDCYTIQCLNATSGWIILSHYVPI